MAPSQRNFACCSASIQPSAQAEVGAVPGNRPALAHGECLAEEGEVGKRFHDLDPRLVLQPLAKRVEVELRLKVVHAGFEDRLAVQADPEADGVGPVQVGQYLMREVVRGLVGGEVEVGKDDDPGLRLLQDLRTPAGVLARVEPLAEDETKRLEHPDHAREEPPRAAERMVIVVRPAEAEPVLPRLLDLRSAVPRLPVVALDLEDELARQVDRAGQFNHPGERCLGRAEPLGVVIESPAPGLPEFAGGQRVARRVRPHPTLAGKLAGKGLEPRVPAPLDDGQARPLAGDPTDAVGPHRVSLDLQPQIMRPGERGDRLDLERDLADLGARPRRHCDPGEHPILMTIDRHPDGI